MSRDDIAKVLFFVFPDKKLITMRAIGFMSGMEFLEEFVRQFDTVPEPWTYDRIMDFRRFTGFLSPDDVDAMGRAWCERVPPNAPLTKLAVISNDALGKGGQATISPLVPFRSVRHFSRYDDALDWINTGELGTFCRESERWGVSRPPLDETFID